MKAPRFEIFKSDKDGQYYFRLRAKNGKTILQSEGYTAKHNAEGGIEAVQEILEEPIPSGFFEIRDNSTQTNIQTWKTHYWFVITGFNGEILGRSETYTSKAGAKRGISSVRKNAPIAEIVDLSKD